MPRKEPMLIKILQEALDTNIQNKKNGISPKYVNLVYEDFPKKIFSIDLPHRTRRLNRKCELFFKKWYVGTGRTYNFFEDYSGARQNLTNSLRRSDYVKLDIYDNKLICRFLNGEEVKERKRLKKELRKLKAEEKKFDNGASNESGYESFNSPESHTESEQDDKGLLLGVEHDHAYVVNSPDKASAEVRGFHNDVQYGSNEAMDVDEVIGTSDESLSSDQDKFDIAPNVGNASQEDFFAIPGQSEDVSLEDLDKIPQDQLIGGNFQELQLVHQDPDLTDAEAKMRGKTFVCKSCNFLGKEVAVLMCELFEEFDVGVTDTFGNVQIIYEEAVLTKIQEYTYVKDLQYYCNGHYLMVILELPFTSYR